MEVVEIEKKFVFNDETENLLKTMGAELVQERSFIDSYYDMPDFQLTRNDHWLRKRGDRWELKCPPASDVDQSGPGHSSITRYAEFDCETEIAQCIIRVLGVAMETGVKLHDVVTNTGCVVFGHFATKRTTYSLEGFTIDLDIADFGYRVGEVEVMVKDTKEVSEAMSRIEKMCRTLGVKTGERIPGKMDTYLKLHNPDHYQLLLDAGIL